MPPSSLEQFLAHAQAELFFDSLEELVTSEEGFGLTTATNLQRAVCWVIQNNTIPDHLWEDEVVQEACGHVRPDGVGPGNVREFLLLAGVRGAKTLICAAACVWFAVKVDLSKGVGAYLKAGEVPRVSLVSALKDNANEAFNYVKGALESKPRLRPLLIDEPTMGAVRIRHPSGREIHIRIIAMRGQGVSLVSRWSAGVLFDEAPRMSSDDADGKINLSGMVNAVRSRMLPGCPIMFIGSPVGAIGYVYKLYEEHFSKESSVTVIKAKGEWLNPVHWTPELVEHYRTNPRLADDYRTDCLAEFRDVEMQMFSLSVIERAMARGPVMLAPEEGRTYAACMDPAGRNNACTLVVGTTDDNIRFTVAVAKDWQGSKAAPLDFNNVFPEIRDVIAPYGSPSVVSDQWAIDPLRSLAVHHKINLSSIAFTPQNKVKLYKAVQTRMNSGLIDLPYHEEMKNDLLRVKLVVKSNGEPSVKLAETADGRHCDFAAVLALLCGGHLEETDLDKYHAQKNLLPDEDEKIWVPPPQAKADWQGLDDMRMTQTEGEGW